MKSKFFPKLIFFLALLGAAAACAPVKFTKEQVEASAPTLVPAIAAHTAEAVTEVAVATPTPEPKKVPAPGTLALCISEVSASRCADAERLCGLAGEWAELYNGSGAAVELSGYSLSDREDNVNEFILPGGVLAPGEYALIDLTDAPFHLKAGETLYLFDTATYAYDSVSVPETDRTFGKNAAGETVLYRYATPGGENRTGYLPEETAPEFEAAGIYINEVSAAGEDEWVELYNGGGAEVSLLGWHLGRSKDALNEIALSGSVAPGGYYVIDGLSLPKEGCRLYLTDENGFYRDEYATGVLSAGLSSGRDSATGQRLFYGEPTKGAANAATGYTGYAADVIFSENGLYQTEPFTLTLSAPGSDIYYTLDGTAPEESGTLYTGPIAVSENITVRACSKKEGCLDSDEVTRCYLFEEKHSVPVISLTMNANDFKKVYKVTERNEIVEKACAVTYYDAEGAYGTCMRASVKAKGRGSLKYAQKSLTFKLRARFGTSYTDYPLFGVGVNEGIRYRAFCLRAGGQDYNRAIIRDTLINRAAQNTAVDTVQTQPVAVYVNGAYLGLFMLQEEMNADYYVSHYGLDKEQIDVINQNAGVRTGTIDGYKALRKLARGVQGSDEDYAKLCAALDIEAWTDYCAIQLIVGNTDVLNQKVVQSRDGKMLFKPMLFDEDSAYGSKKTDLMYKYFKSAGFTPSSSDEILCNNDVFKALFRCPTWREKFWHRVVELLETDFSPENLNTLIDALAEEIEPELPRQIQKYKFHASVKVWEEKVAELKSVIAGRTDVVYDQLKHYFGISSADIREYAEQVKIPYGS